MKDFLEADNRIQDIPSSLFVNRYKDVSFDVESLLNNLSIKKTIHIRLTQMYNDHNKNKNLKQVFTEKSHSRHIH